MSVNRVLILHGGMHKTGTTSLQMDFDKHREHLLEHGILFPKTGFTIHSNTKGIASSGHDKLVFGLDTKNRHIENELRQEIEKATRHCELLKYTTLKIFISCENFSHIFLSSELRKKQLNSLYSYFHEFTQSWNFLLSLKQPTKMWVSLYREMITNGFSRYGNDWKKFEIDAKRGVDILISDLIWAEQNGWQLKQFVVDQYIQLPVMEYLTSIGDDMRGDTILKGMDKSKREYISTSQNETTRAFLKNHFIEVKQFPNIYEILSLPTQFFQESEIERIDNIFLDAIEPILDKSTIDKLWKIRSSSLEYPLKELSLSDAPTGLLLLSKCIFYGALSIPKIIIQRILGRVWLRGLIQAMPQILKNGFMKLRYPSSDTLNYPGYSVQKICKDDVETR